MRRSLYKLLRSSPALADFEILQGSAVEDAPSSRPFIVIRFGGRAQFLPALCEIWVHDNPGSYLRIDSTIAEIRKLLREVVHYSFSESDSIAEATWESDSTDLYDDGYRTITKYTRHRLVGRGF